MPSSASTSTAALLLLFSSASATSASASSLSPHDSAVATCKSLNKTEIFGMMHGFGLIDGYSRNSGCGGVCGRETFRWDNGTFLMMDFVVLCFDRVFCIWLHLQCSKSCIEPTEVKVAWQLLFRNEVFRSYLMNSFTGGGCKYFLLC